MVAWGKGRNQGQVGTWPPSGTAGRRHLPAWPDHLSDLLRAISAKVRQWATIDAGPGRLLPWLPVAFGLGIAAYFSAEREPAPWAAATLALVCG